jgi:death-on-curing protein
VGHAALETFLVLNGHELASSVDEAERTILGVAAGQLSRDDLKAWIERSIRTIA